MTVYIGDAEVCLQEAEQLQYAYFNPELDNFGEKVTIDDITFRIKWEMQQLDDGSLRGHVEDAIADGYSDVKWNTNRNKAWRRKAVVFLNRWSDIGEEHETK